MWYLIAALFNGHKALACIKLAHFKGCGHKGLRGVYIHFIGLNNFDHMVSAAEKRFQNSMYHGVKRNWKFVNYVTIHKEQHTILYSFTEYGYRGIDEHTKVCYLMEGIKTSSLDEVKASIMRSANYQDEFDNYVILYKYFIKKFDSQSDLKVAVINMISVSGIGNSK